MCQRGNHYLRVLFVQAARVVLVRIKHLERYGLKSWIEAAKKRLHPNVLAIALANKLARIAWAVLHKGRAFGCVKSNEAYRPANPRAVLGPVKAWPGNAAVLIMAIGYQIAVDREPGFRVQPSG
jgi:hypothetical protein